MKGLIDFILLVLTYPYCCLTIIIDLVFGTKLEQNF